MIQTYNSEQLLEFIQTNINKPEFNYFINSCINKWFGIKPECDALDIIMNGISVNYKISINELLWDKKQTIPRSIMFYMVKKSIPDLSFETIGDIFKRQKSYVFKAYDEAEFMVERHCKKDAVLAVNDVKSKLKVSDLLPASFENE